MKIKKNTLLNVIFLIIIIQPKLFTQYSLVNYSYFFLNLFIFLFYIIKNIKKLHTLPIILFFWLIFRLYIFFIMFFSFNFKEFDSWLMLTVMVSNIVLIVDDNIKQNLFKNFLLCSTFILSLYFFINIFTLLIFENGIIKDSSTYYNPDRDYYFLGIKIMYQTYMYPLLANLFLLRKKCSERNWFIIFIISFSLILINVFYANISTALVVLSLIIIMTLFVKKIKLYMPLILLFILLINYAFINLNFSKYFAFIFENILGKDITLSSRIYIWENAKNCILSQPLVNLIFGNAYKNGVNFAYGHHAHNQWLNYIYYFGIVGTLIFILFILVLCHKYNKNYRILYIICIGLLIGTITNSYFDYSHIYFPFIYLYFLNKNSVYKSLLR